MVTSISIGFMFQIQRVTLKHHLVVFAEPVLPEVFPSQ